jgi:hypothetical protein
MNTETTALTIDLNYDREAFAECAGPLAEPGPAQVFEEWVWPLGSTRPLRRRDYPGFGVVSYSEN